MEKRVYVQTAEPCPDCESPLAATLRGTQRVCLACVHRVVPRGVRAPYERGTGIVRQVKSQRERDLEAVALARRKGVMLAELAALAADKNLHPESRPVIEWFADEVKTATGNARLDELAGLLPDAGIRRRHWWQSQPATLTAPVYDDEDQGDDDEYDDESDAGEIETPPSLAPVKVWRESFPGVDYASELAARQWRFQPHGAGLCQLIHLKPHGWDIPPEECLHRAEHAIPGGYVCGPCYHALNTPLVGNGRPMTWAGALARLGWRLVPLVDGCQVSENGLACGAETARSVGEGWACSRHYAALAMLITQSQR